MRYRILGIALVTALVVVAPAGAATRDTTKPRVAFTTQNEAVLVSAPAEHELTRIRGTATDLGGSGIRRVVVVACGNAQRDPDGGFTCGGSGVGPASPLYSTTAALRCTSSTNRRCTWAAGVPTLPGNYVVVATAYDKAGNRRTAGPIFITVV